MKDSERGKKTPKPFDRNVEGLWTLGQKGGALAKEESQGHNQTRLRSEYRLQIPRKGELMIRYRAFKATALFVATLFLSFNFCTQSFADSCEADSKQYCSTALSGSEQAVECLKDHYQDVSQECYDSLAQEKQQSSGDSRQACKADAEKYCANVQSGGGRIIKCLMEHSQDISQECSSSLAQHKQQSGGGFRQACRNDADKYCADVQPGGGRIIKCLMGHSQELSQECSASLEKVRMGRGPGGERRE